MGQPDISMKGLLGHPDVFADIINAFVFEGRQVLSGENMRQIQTEGNVAAGDGQLSQIFRDVCMEHVKSGMQFLIIGIENQMDIDYTMPMRCMGYDYQAYEKQVTELVARNKKKGIYAGMHRILKNQRIHPVITIVLYYGEEQWNKPLDIRDMMLIPEGEEYQSILPYIQNYRMNLVHVNQLTEQEMELLRSDFKYIAKVMNKRYNQERVLESFKHDFRRIIYLKDTLQTIRALTRNRRILDAVSGKIEDEEGPAMGNVLDYLIEKTEAETEAKVESKFARLTGLLLQEKNYDDLHRITVDKEFRDSLYEKYRIL